MSECQRCHCEIRENIQKHEKSQSYKKTLEKVIIKHVEKDISVDRLKDILNKRIKEHLEKFTIFTKLFCWKVHSIEYSITIGKDEVLDSRSNRESLDSILKSVFNQIKIDYFEEFTLMFVFEKKKLTYRFYFKQPM